MYPRFRVSCYTDAGYLTDADDLKSQTRYVFVLNGGVVDWKSTKQSIFATSSAEAEYIAAYDASKEAVWVRKFISGLGVVPTIEEPINMYCDNTGAITIANESGITKGARHFRAKVHYLREVIEYGDIKLEKVHTDDNLADPFTKALAFPKHSEHTRNIGMLPARLPSYAGVDGLVVISGVLGEVLAGIREVLVYSLKVHVGAGEVLGGVFKNNALAKLPMLKLGEYEMWEIRIKQYFQIQDYALWEVIENGNSWVPIPVTATETGPSTGLKMTVPSTAEEKICKKNDVKARSLLLMALPNEHQLTFDQYVDAQSMFAAIKARFGGNEATKKTQKALLKQQYENFNASSSESLDSIFNRLQKLVSRLAILGVVTPPEDLNVKFLRSLPSEWDTHVVVWMNKPDFDTMGLDDLYNNFKIVEQKVKRSAGANNDDKNLAFLTASGASSINNINTVNPEVSTGTSKVNTASTEINTASFSDATVYAFLSTQPQGSQLVHEDLEQLHDDDLEEMDLKWNMALLSMRARKFYQRTGRKIIIDGSSTAGYDKSKVECFNCHKMGHFARECRAPRSKDNRNWNQGSSSKAVRIEDASEKAMCAIDGAGFDWSDMAKEEIQANMALMAFSDSEVTNDKSCSKSCLKNYEALKKQYDDLLVKLDDTGFKASTYKRGLSILEGQIIKYKESEVLFSEEIALLKRSVGHKE
ncbi:putative ribonuclease H-like domain-containing protein [Tanacetum coccineum]